MKTMDQLTTTIGKGLSEHLQDYKFVKSRQHLIKPTNEGWQAIVLGVLQTSEPGTVKLAAHAQIRLDRIEEQYAPHHPYLSSSEAKMHATLAINCDQLLADSWVVHGFRADDENINLFIDEYANALKLHVLPWLEQYSNEDAVFDGLIDQDPLNWITSDRLTRYPVLMAILADRKQWAEFDRIAEEFADFCNTTHTQVYKPLAEALTSGLRMTT